MKKTTLTSNNSIKTKDSFIIYRSFIDATNSLPDVERLKIFDAIFAYALDEKETILEGISYTVFTLIKPQLDANRKRFENGCKKKKISKTQAKGKQTGSKHEANHNVNLNLNPNLNHHLNQNEELDILLDEFIFIIQGKLNKQIDSKKRTSWRKDLKNLIEKDLEKRTHSSADLRDVFACINENYGKEYFPVVQSAGALREKFSKIEAYMVRNGKLSNSDTQKDPFVKSINDFVGRNIFKTIVVCDENSDKVIAWAYTGSDIDFYRELPLEIKQEVKARVTKHMGVTEFTIQY